MLRDWGAEKKYHHVLKGYNYRMEGIQGAILRVKLRHLEALDRGAAARRAARYDALLADAGVATPTPMPRSTRHVYHVYAVRTDRARRRWQEALQRARASRPASTTRFPCTCSRRSPTSATARATSRTSERAAHEVLSLPMFPELTAEQSDDGVRTPCAGWRAPHEAERRMTGPANAAARGARPLLIFPCNGNGLEALDCLGDAYRCVGFVDDTPEKQGDGRRTATACFDRAALGGALRCARCWRCRAARRRTGSRRDADRRAGSRRRRASPASSTRARASRRWRSSAATCC